MMGDGSGPGPLARARLGRGCGWRWTAVRAHARSAPIAQAADGAARPGPWRWAAARCVAAAALLLLAMKSHFHFHFGFWCASMYLDVSTCACYLLHASRYTMPQQRRGTMCRVPHIHSTVIAIAAAVPRIRFHNATKPPPPTPMIHGERRSKVNVAHGPQWVHEPRSRARAPCR